MRAAEYDITVNGNEYVIEKYPVNTVFCTYGADGMLVRKRIVPADGEAREINYETSESGSTTVKFTVGDKEITSHSGTDGLGRKTFDELKLGSGCVSRQLSYHAGVITDEHRANSKVKSAATTQLVSQIMYSDGRTISYEYDAEERITKVIDSVDGTTEYTYDALGQLLTETVNGELENTMTYDNYGNIRTRNGISYTYGNSSWKDLLTRYDGERISYDAQGNPTSYRGHTLTWEKGRQLKKFVKSDGPTVTYAYNANGIRTNKTVGSVEHTYILDGTKILRETWGDNTLIPMYDNEDSVCGIIYNDVPFYFQKNLQGDVIAIFNQDAEVVARYKYDAWGVCTVESDTSGCGIASINPYRYRSYYYDAETELYYLQSRYYDAGVGRFINADSQFDSGANLIGYNIFVYCGNNPISNVDYMGTSLLLVIGIGLLVGAIIGGVASYVKYREVKISWIAGGAIVGALLAAGGYWVYNVFKGAMATWSAYKAAQIGAGASTSSAAIGRMFEKFYYGYNNIAVKYQQVVWKNFRFDAIFKNRIIELKNYDWTKYSSSQISRIARQFYRQAEKYTQAIGNYVGGQKIKGITFYFSSKPPRVIIDLLRSIGITVDWVK